MTSEIGTGGELQPRPFGDRPQPPPGGCSSPLLVGCAVAVVLLGVLLLVALLKVGSWAPAAFRWSLEQVERHVSERLPEGLDESDRQRLATAFDAAADAVAEGTADRAALERLQSRVLELLREERPSEEQIRALIEALEEVATERAPRLGPGAPELAAQLGPSAAGG